MVTRGGQAIGALAVTAIVQRDRRGQVGDAAWEARQGVCDTLPGVRMAALAWQKVGGRSAGTKGAAASATACRLLPWPEVARDRRRVETMLCSIPHLSSFGCVPLAFALERHVIYLHAVAFEDSGFWAALTGSATVTIMHD